MTPQDLLKYVAQGKEYEKLDSAGKALGCMAPVYALYPEIPRYEWPEEGTGFVDAVLTLLRKHGRHIDLADVQPGDVIAFRMPFGFLHLAVYMGDDWIVHCMTGETWERCRFSYICRRVEGAFRWEGGE